MAWAVITCFEEIRNITLLQSNARGISRRLLYFYQFLHKCRFPGIVILESRVGNDFRLSHYKFHFDNGTVINRGFVGKRDLTCLSHANPPNRDNEYVALTVTISEQTLTDHMLRYQLDSVNHDWSTSFSLLKLPILLLGTLTTTILRGKLGILLFVQEYLVIYDRRN